MDQVSFGVIITTEDSYFVLDGSRSAHGKGLQPRNFWLLLLTVSKIWAKTAAKIEMPFGIGMD